MQPEPTPQDVAAVAAAMGQQPAPEPQQQPTEQPAQQQPAQQQPAAPTQQPAPSSQPTDPFAALFASEPAAQQTDEPQQQPTEPAAPQTPAEPAAQQQQPQQQPQAPQQPAQQSQQGEYESYEQYMNRVLQNVPQAPEQPDPEKIDPNDPAAIKKFFDDIVNTAVARAESEAQRTQAIHSSERQLWDSAMDKYGSLRTNKDLRDMVHNIRMANFQRGIAMTPTQAAEKLLTSLQQQYQRGVADNQVVTTIESVQPQGGQSGAPVPTSLDKQNVYQAVQDGGETALASILDAEIKAGRL